MTKLVIIEGPDNTGKTTVINRLMKKYDNIYYIHCQKPVNADPILAALEQTNLFNKILQQIRHMTAYIKPELIILDRSWFGEYVYGCKYRGNGKEYVIDMIQKCINKLNEISEEIELEYYPILLTVDNPVFCIKNDDGLSLSHARLDNITDEVNRFNEIAEKFNINKVIVNSDLNFRPKDDIFTDVLYIINK